MARVLVIHPSTLVRASHGSLLRAGGWQVSEAASRADALLRLSSPKAMGFNDLVLVDLSNWTVPGTALVRNLRRQVAHPAPVLIVQPTVDDENLAKETARRAGANLILPMHGAPADTLVALSHLSGLPWPREARAAPGRAQALTLPAIWQQQLDLLDQPDLAAATVASARHVFELLLVRRQDGGAALAALTLTGLPGGPRPLRGWAVQHHPEGATSTPSTALPVTHGQAAVAQPLLVVEAGGEYFGLPLNAETAPSCWWTDGMKPARSTAAGVSVAAVEISLARWLGPSTFRRRLMADRATVVLRRGVGPRQRPVVLRVGEVLGLQHLPVQPCGPWLTFASGCTGFGRAQDGRALLVLDAARLLRRVDTASPSDMSWLR